MKYDVTFTEQAENAAGQLDRIEEKILSLGEYPEKSGNMKESPGRVEIHELCLLIIMLFSISPIRQRNWLQ